MPSSLRALRPLLQALLGVGLLAGSVAAQAGAPPAYVDSAGVLRWTETGREVASFGVNYTAPFAYAYRAHEYVGADRRSSIDMDVAHLARLGVNAYRVHVWDRQISDRDGNLLENEHLDLFDYLINRLEERGIRLVLTPIVWGGPGYPEPDAPTPGFSNRWSKGGMTVDPTAIAVQQKYLRQFLAHVNRYNRRSYLDDPGIIGIELFNEPVHPGTSAQTTAFIDALASAAREAGWRKPIFYNFAQGWSPAHGQAVCSAAIQGITFQWYPTGLVRGSDVRTNMLPNVDRYVMPADSTPECRGKARLVYEFDSADVLGSYLYPAMARSFRAVGMQWVTQFAYDPVALAPFNTEYQTHYLNLLYAPHKAISFLIAGEAFRRLPRGGSYGTYPQSARFGPFRVSYEQDLSEMNAPEAFYYSNDTDTRPVAPARLEHVAGAGSSPGVAYEGTGAYFLDRLEPGVWRLEVYPDAVQLADPFGRPSVDHPVTRLVWREWPITVRLPDLGPSFSARAIDAGHTFQATASNSAFAVRPGVYILRRAGVAGTRWEDAQANFGAGKLGEFHVPAAHAAEPVVFHRPALEAVAGQPLAVRATVATDSPTARVTLRWRRAGGTFESAPMRAARAYTWEATIPAGALPAGALEYAIDVTAAGTTFTFPALTAADSLRRFRVLAPREVGAIPTAAPDPRPIAADSVWHVPVVPATAPIVLFDADRDRWSRMLLPHPFDYVRFQTSFADGDSAGRHAFRFGVADLMPAPHEFAFRAFLGPEGRGRLSAVPRSAVLRVRARSVGAADSLVVALVQRDGRAFGAVVPLTASWQDATVPLSALQPVPLRLLPRPYPLFLPNELAVAGGARAALDPSSIDGVQVTVEAGIYGEAARATAHAFELERIQLETAR